MNVSVDPSGRVISARDETQTSRSLGTYPMMTQTVAASMLISFQAISDSLLAVALAVRLISYSLPSHGNLTSMHRPNARTCAVAVFSFMTASQYAIDELYPPMNPG